MVAVERERQAEDVERDEQQRREDQRLDHASAARPLRQIAEPGGHAGGEHQRQHPEAVQGADHQHHQGGAVEGLGPGERVRWEAVVRERRAGRGGAPGRRRSTVGGRLRVRGDAAQARDDDGNAGDPRADGHGALLPAYAGGADGDEMVSTKPLGSTTSNARVPHSVSWGGLARATPAATARAATSSMLPVASM